MRRFRPVISCRRRLCFRGKGAARRRLLEAPMLNNSLVGFVGWVCVCVLCLTACATQVLHQASALVPGATPAQVRELLGEPLDRQFQGNQQAWQYCETGLFQDTFVIVWFADSKVTGLRTYHSSVGDPGLFCNSHLRAITWDEAPEAQKE